MQAAENLCEKMWGQNLDQKLKVHSEVIGVRWKYLSKDYLDLLQLPTLGYLEDVLLFRDEYSTAMASFKFRRNKEGRIPRSGRHWTARNRYRPISYRCSADSDFLPGKTCFLYYLLLQKLSNKNPVALERLDCFFLFSEDGVTMHAKTLYIYPFPKITWALSDSNEKIEHPCDAFLDSAQQGRIWVVQTTSPLESRWEKWQELYSAGMFVMKYLLLKRLRLSGMCHGFCFSLSDPSP